MGAEIFYEMYYKTELQKFATGQYVYAGVRITLACVVPAIVLAYFGVLKEYFLFPLATSFVGLTDLPGPFIRRRNSQLFAVVSFFFVALLSGLVKEIVPLVFLLIFVLGMFFTLIGVYGQRLMSVGSIALIVMAIFIDPHLAQGPLWKNLLIFLAGSLWFVFIFLVVSKIQPYKLASQMIGENYIELANFLSIRARLYLPNPNFSKINGLLINKQIQIKELQEGTRETVFKTRTLVNESTTTSRLLMLMLLNSFELHEKLMTSESDYETMQKDFGETGFLPKIHDFLLLLCQEMTNIGIALQGGNKVSLLHNLDEKHTELYKEYFAMRERELKAGSHKNFIVLRHILIRVNDITKDIKGIYNFFYQDEKLAKSLSSGLDYGKFIPKEEKLSYKVLKNNISIDSQHFRHAIRLTLALLIGYAFSFVDVLSLGHSYWILITILAILKPSFSITKSRNLLRLYGTIAGGVFSYGLLYFVDDHNVLLAWLLSSMIICFTFLRSKYFTAVFFMTVYIFLTFNFVNPGNVDVIFKDRLFDTFIGGVISFLVSYLVLPVWEHTQNADLMKKSVRYNKNYFDVVMSALETLVFDDERFRLERKDAMIALANLSANFQRMLSDPKNQQSKMEALHQFVTTSHLSTAYIASLSQYAKMNKNVTEEIDIPNWKLKIDLEFQKIFSFFGEAEYPEQGKIKPKDKLDSLLTEQKQTEDAEVQEIHLTEVQNVQNLLNLIYDVVKEQRRVVEKNYKE